MTIPTIPRVGLLSLTAETLCAEATPVRFAVVGLIHHHARGFLLRTHSQPELRWVARVEPNRERAARYVLPTPGP